jgi:phosphatidate cytidylyltransferase
LKAPPGFGRNLALRVATALVVLPLLLAALFLGPPLLGVGIVAAALLLGMWELLALLEGGGLRPFRGTGLVLAVSFFAEVVWPGRPPIGPAAALLLLAVALRRAPAGTGSIPSAAGTLLGALYLGALGGTIGALRVIEPASAGAWRLLLLLAIVMLADTVAFFVGHAWGRRRLAPRLSPGKSVEGAVGAIAGGVLGALAVRAIGLPSLALPHAVALGAAVAALGIAGDLFESLLKRWAGVKDSGALFPGHGGMLDRLDSLLFGGPVLYYYFLYAQ